MSERNKRKANGYQSYANDMIGDEDDEDELDEDDEDMNAVSGKDLDDEEGSDEDDGDEMDSEGDGHGYNDPDETENGAKQLSSMQEGEE